MEREGISEGLVMDTMLTKEEIEEFMAEADKVRKVWQIQIVVGN